MSDIDAEARRKATMDMANTAAAYSVGQRVRVRVGELARVALVACEGDAADTYDVVFADKSIFSDQPTEENGS
jgi:hypothetical protein